jgi:hypothetical protein
MESLEFLVIGLAGTLAGIVFAAVKAKRLSVPPAPYVMYKRCDVGQRLESSERQLALALAARARRSARTPGGFI